MKMWLYALVLAQLSFATAANSAPALQSADGGYEMSLTRGSRLMIAARINGDPRRALLDSAAEVTVIDVKLAHALHLDGGRTAVGQGSGKESFDTKLVNGVTLEAIGLSLAGQTIAVADLSDVGRRLLGQPLEIILGREIFDAARLAIDIDGQRIRVVTRKLEPAGTRLLLSSEHGVETIPVRIESRATAQATFDLGNGAEVLLSQAFVKRMGFLSDGRSVARKAGGGLGGEALRQTLTLRSIQIAGREFKDVPAAIDPQASASDVNVGVDILRHFKITTDFAQHAVWLAMEH